jgi:hypothetical protein
MKTKETANESWPELDETHQAPFLTQTDQTQSSSVTIDMANSNVPTAAITKEDLNQPYYDTEQQQQKSTS